MFAAVAALVFTRFYSTTAARYTAARTYSLNWRVTIPDGYNMVCHYESDHGFHGDGYRYTVFEARQNGVVGVGRDVSAGISEIETGAASSDEGLDCEIANFIDEVSKKLEIRDEDAVTLSSGSRWKRLKKDNGSMLAIISDVLASHVYFAEKLL
ncbi:MAG: hypothetical protein LBD92_04595 [Oscillospiraceae bacterium]|nr:hypothetical protein [Oscillospiraceae bacterium]